MKPFWPSFLLTGLLIVATLLSTEQSLWGKPLSPEAQKLTPTEKYIVQQVQAGEEADLKDQFGDAADKRTVRSHFLENLLTDVLPGIMVTRRGIQIYGAVFPEPVDLENGFVRHAVRLEGCEFRGNVNLYHAVFERNVSFDNSTFTSKADFVSMKVGGSLFLWETVFQQEALLTGAVVADRFELNQAHFNHQDKAPSFARMKVGQLVSMDEAVFEGGMMGGGIDIGGLFSAVGCEFHHPDKLVDFRAMRVGEAAFLSHVTFSGPVDFSYVTVERELRMEDCRFLNTKAATELMRMKIGGLTVFERNHFAMAIRFTGSNFLTLIITAPKTDNFTFDLLDLSHVAIARDLNLTDLMIRRLRANSLQVGGDGVLSSVHIEQEADLENSEFGSLQFSQVQWPDPKLRSIGLQGMNYKTIYATSDHLGSHASLAALADRAVYSPDIYRGLEAFFLRQGYVEDANTIYVAGRWRRWHEYGQWKTLNFYWDYLLGQIGFGRYPGRALLPCEWFVFLGWILFVRKKMEPVKANEAPAWTQSAPAYSSFWYSLELFMPFVKLPMEEAWRPKRACRFLWFYAKVHALAGWILVPITLAAITGLLK